MKLIVWDFHGTLEEGNELAVLEMSNTVLINFGYSEQFTDQDYYKLYGKKWFEYFEYLIPKAGKEKHLELQEACFAYSNSHQEIIAKYIKPAKNAHKTLELLKRKHDQILISNTKPESLEVFTRAIKIHKYFNAGKAFATDAHVFNKTKKDVLSSYLKDKKFDELFSVGDSPSDIELGHYFGAKTVLYGHESRDIKVAEADFKIRDLFELVDIVS